MADQEIKVTLKDHGDGDGTLNVTVKANEHGVEIYAEGYGDKGTEPPHGTPVFLELKDGVLHVYVWSDINEEDPTHSISLAGAKESNRENDQ